MNDRLAQEWKALAADAARLDDLKFLKVYQLLEQVAETPGIQPAFAAMRPRLQALRPPRRPSLSRLFFRPLEDLLDDPEGYERRLNRVSRTTLLPCWRAVKDRFDPGVLSGVRAALAAGDAHDRRAVIEACTPLWLQGGVAVREVVKACENNLKYKVDNFGRDDDVLRQLEVVADIVACGAGIEGLKLSLPPRPIGDLAESHVETIRTALNGVGKEEAAKARPMLLVLCSRMKRPGDLLKLLGDVKLGSGMGEKEQLTKDLSGYVVGNLLRQTGDFERSSATASPGDLASEAERLTEGLSSVNDTVMGLRDRDLTNRVNAARTEIGGFVVKNIVTDLDRDIVTSLFRGEGLPTDDAEMKRAEQMALALRRSLKLAPQLGISREVNAKLTDVRRSVEAETVALLAKARPGPNGPDPAMQRQMFNSLRMIEILAGSDEAERLYKDWKRRMS